MNRVKLYRIYAIAKLLKDGQNTKVFTNNRLDEIMNLTEEINNGEMAYSKCNTEYSKPLNNK